MNKSLLIFTLTFSLSPLVAQTTIPFDAVIDPLAPKAEQLQQVINLLNYVREENRDVAGKINELVEQTDIALEEHNVSSFIDIIIQALIYVAARFKHYDEHFIGYVRGVKKLSLDEYRE